MGLKLNLCDPYFTDPEDLIFPRTATRQGPKYQANVPPAPDPYNHPPGECYVIVGTLTEELKES